MTTVAPVLLDHRGQPIARERPRLSAQRPRKAIRAKYDSAATTDENTRHWTHADSLGPDSALNPSIRATIRNRARYESANDTFASGMIDSLANDVIGTGPQLQCLSGNKGADTRIEIAWWEWMQAANLARKLRTMRRAKAVDGETFGTMFTNPQLRSPVRLDIRPHEAEMIANPIWGQNLTDLSDGIVFDDFGNVSAYYLLRQHPGENLSVDWRGVSEYETVPAPDMLHLFDQRRPGQSRGVSEISPALPLYAMRRRYALATLRAAEIAAMISWVLQTQQAPNEYDLAEPFDPIEFERGQGMTLPPGYQVNQLKAEQPTTAYEMFTKAIIREIARCLSMPYNIAAGDSSDYNYSSARLEIKNYAKAIRVERSYWETTALDVLFSRWYSEARLIPELLPNGMRASRLVPLHQWRWDGDEHIDPVKEAQAVEIDLRSNCTTLAQVYAKKGQDWEEQLVQRAKEIKLLEQLGITQAQAAAGPKPPPTEEEEPEEEEPEDDDAEE